LQQGAADTFLQRLRLPIESALATEFIVAEDITRTVAGDLVVTEATVDTSADFVLITIPDTGVTSIQPPPPEPTPAANDTPTQEPKPAEAREKESKQPVMMAQEPVDTTAPAGKTVPEQPPVPELQPAEQVTLQPEPAVTRMAKSPQGTQRAREAVTTQPQAMPEEETRPPQPAEPPVMKQPPVAPVASTVTAAVPQTAPATQAKTVIQPDAPVKPAANGLLVSASPAVAWPALLQALHDLEIPIDQEDGQQHLLTTGWVNADYDEKNHLLVLRSEEVWAFNMFGKGIERQQYQVVMVPANQGVRSIIYAYNTGYQQQIDQTPDSSQTLLVWEDQDTSPDVALALLRRLRIVIPH
jgi:hypothetical protein